MFLEQAKGDICRIIEKELCERKALKFYLTANPELERLSTEGEVTSAPYLHSLPSVVLESSDLDEQYQTAADLIERSVGCLPRGRVRLHSEIFTGMHCEYG